MNRKLLLYPFLFILIIIGLTSCGRYSYPREVGFYRVKKNKSKDVVVKHILEPREPLQINGLPPYENTIRLSSVNSEPTISYQPAITEKYIHSKKNRAIKNISIVVTELDKLNSNNKIIENISASQRASILATSHLAYGSEHMALRGLIFIVIGILLQGLWFLGPIGFIFAIVGIVLIIYGLVLVLESL